MKIVLIASMMAILAAGPVVADESAQPPAPAQYNPPAAKDGYSYPDCYCTDSTGERVELGRSVCLQIGSRQIWARCDMSLNNPTWRHSDEGCPSA